MRADIDACLGDLAVGEFDWQTYVPLYFFVAVNQRLVKV